MSSQARSLVSHPHHVNSSQNARLLRQSCQFEPDRSSATHCVNSSWNARLLPPPCQFEPDRSSATPTRQFEHNHSCPTPTMSIRAGTLVSHLHLVNLSTTAHVTPPPCPLKPGRSCPTPTMLTQARTLVFRIHHVNSSPTTHLPPPHQFKRNRSCPNPIGCHFISTSIHDIL